MAVIWIFGNSGAGKTTLARLWRQEQQFVHLDGDDLRGVWQLGFSQTDRFEQNLRAARLAKIISDQGNLVVVTLICPYEELRDLVDAICAPVWFYIPGGRVATKEYPFELPGERAITLQPIPGEGNIERLRLLLTVPEPVVPVAL